jgi:hypothetical protein
MRLHLTANGKFPKAVVVRGSVEWSNTKDHQTDADDSIPWTPLCAA